MATMMFDAPSGQMNTEISADVNKSAVSQSEEQEDDSALAKGLPAAWSIEPPAIVVRRKARSI